MSKPSAASASKLPQFPQKSAWARGPPNTSSAPTPRSQSPAPTNVTSPVATSHSRRPSTLGQAVAFKDGARSPVSATQSASAVTFGSIDDAAATISSSPASVPPIKTEVPKAFGSVSATPSPISTVNGKQPASSSASVSSTVKPSTHHVTKPAAFNVKSLFMTHSSGPAPSAPSSSQSASDSAASASPSTRPAPLPSYPSSSQPPSHTPQSAQFPSHSFQTFVPGSGLRPQPNGNNTNGPPRSPVYSRPSPNGVAPPVGVNGRPQGPPGTPAAPPTPLSANMPSPRMGHPHAAAPPQMPPGQQPVPWQYYYPYPGMGPEYMYPQGWHVPQHVVPPGQHPHSPGVPQPVPHQPPHQHAQPGIPISPRHPPSNLHPPGTPSVTPAVPSVPIPSPHLHSTPLSSVSSPPSTPASSNGPSAATMDRNAKPFVPGRKVVIKNEQGVEVVLDAFKKQHSSQGSITGFQSPVVPSSPARVPIRMETEEAKNKRLAEEERQRKEKEDAEKAKKEAEEKAKHEEEERIRKEKEEAERLVKEKEEQERKAKEEEERRKKEAEETEQRKKQEEEERQRKEEEEKRKEEEEEKEKLRKEEEEKARLKQEEEEKIKKEQESKEAEERAAQEVKVAPPAAPVASVEKESKEESKEEGEIDDSEKAAENDEIRDKVSDRPPLRLDTTLDKKRPGPLDLSGTKGPIAPPLPSALASARIIDDINRVEYPEGIRSPKVELNVNAKDGKFKYDRDFLLQFMAICKEKPDSLPPLDAIGLEPSDQNYPITRGGSGRRQNSVSMGPPSSNAPRQALHGLGISAGGKSGFTMGQFSTPSGKTMTSEDRFAMSSRSASMSGTPGMPFGSARPSPMSRSSSQGGPGGVPMGSNRTRSKRGEKRNANTNAPQSSYNASTSLAQALEPVAPLEVSANRWTPASVSKKPAAAANEDSPEVVERKVKGLLNKLTMERFDSISDQIITWANKSEKEKDGRTLIQVIKLVFEKATDEATYSEMYARLCRKMMEQISPKVQDDGIRNSEGKHITGGHLFRKYLLNRCQEDFERGWASKESTAAAAAGKAAEDEAAKTASGGDDEAALYSEEYYAAAKAKRQGLGLIRFIGELFKLQMLTERIMHECVKKLLGNVANPEEEEIESLCKLLTTVGALLDTPKARAHMDVYFSRMKELARGGNVNSRMQFMLLDVIELRERNWIPRNLVAAPTTIAAVHEQAAKEKASVDTSRLSMSRGGSRRGGERGDAQTGPDGWAVAGGSQPRPPAKAGDLSQFGKISKSGPMTFGPSGVFANKEKPKRESTLSRGNMFSMLSQNPELANEVQAPSSKSSRPPSRKPSIDLGSGGAPAPEAAPSVRRKLVLQPRTVPKPEATPAASVAGSDDEGAEGGSQAPAAADSITEEQALKQIDEDIKELLSIRNIDESEEYFKKLPAEHRHHLVEKLVNLGVEAKEDVVDVIAQVFARAVSKDLCSPAHFEEGFLPTAEIIDDVAIDAPKALTFFAKLIKGAGLDKDAERRGRIVSKSIDSEKLSNLLAS